jgi:site-specific DNA-methyltransferase (adenine-specific)
MKYDYIKQGDCLELMKELPDGSIDLIVTDPPYLMSYKTGRRKDKSHKFCTEIAGDNDEELIKNYIVECYRIMKDNTAMYMFCNSNKVDFFKRELEKYFTIKNMIVWVKNNHTAGDLVAQFGKKYELIFLVNKGRCPIRNGRITDVWEFNRVVGKNQLHQNQKPLELIEQCIEKHSDEGAIVFDGFMGSGTTAVACVNTNRKFIGFELDEKYFNIAQQRINDVLNV